MTTQTTAQQLAELRRQVEEIRYAQAGKYERRVIRRWRKHNA